MIDGGGPAGRAAGRPASTVATGPASAVDGGSALAVDGGSTLGSALDSALDSAGDDSAGDGSATTGSGGDPDLLHAAPPTAVAITAIASTPSRRGTTRVRGAARERANAMR
jgi:hypothetical protein